MWQVLLIIFLKWKWNHYFYLLSGLMYDKWITFLQPLLQRGSTFLLCHKLNFLESIFPRCLLFNELRSKKPFWTIFEIIYNFIWISIHQSCSQIFLLFSLLIFDKVKNSEKENANKYKVVRIIRILSNKCKSCQVFRMISLQDDNYTNKKDCQVYPVALKSKVHEGSLKVEMGNFFMVLARHILSWFRDH